MKIEILIIALFCCPIMACDYEVDEVEIHINFDF